MMKWGRRVARMGLLLACVLAAAVGAGPLDAQSADAVEVPLRVEKGRLLVTAEGPDGSRHDLVLGLGTPILTESGAAALGAMRSELTLGGVEVQLESAVEVPDRYLEGSSAVGVLGGNTLNRYDILIDVPNGRLLLKASARSVRWPGIALSGSVPIEVFHDVLLRADVEFGGELVGGLIDLSKPGFEVGEALADHVSDGTASSFRMGYGSWTDLPGDVVDSPVFQRWDADGRFVVLGASIAYECAIAISWYHRELRTCTG